MKTTVSEKGRITIPKPIRTKLGLRAGQILEVREEGGRLVAFKVLREDPVERVSGILKLGKTTDQVMRELRGAADAIEASAHSRRRRR